MFAEDLSVYTDPAGTGDTAVVEGSDMYGIFERQYVEVANVEGYYPTFLVDSADADMLTKKETSIVLQDVEYYAVSKRPDGTGMTLIVLEAV